MSFTVLDLALFSFRMICAEHKTHRHTHNNSFVCFPVFCYGIVVVAAVGIWSRNYIWICFACLTNDWKLHAKYCSISQSFMIFNCLTGSKMIIIKHMQCISVYRTDYNHYWASCDRQIPCINSFLLSRSHLTIQFQWNWIKLFLDHEQITDFTMPRLKTNTYIHHVRHMNWSGTWNGKLHWQHHLSMNSLHMNWTKNMIFPII